MHKSQPGLDGISRVTKCLCPNGLNLHNLSLINIIRRSMKGIHVFTPWPINGIHEKKLLFLLFILIGDYY